VDRNFAVDYTLKSLEKLLDGHVREAVRSTRVIVKDAAYRVLGGMLDSIAGFPSTTDDGVAAALDDRIRQMVDTEFAHLREELTDLSGRLRVLLPGEHAALLQREFDHWLWRAGAGWTLINAADPCDT
jgi:hypothetical protein